jgi:hypothetical protein
MIRNAVIGARRRAENGLIDMLEPRVLGREEFAWRNIFDCDSIRDELLVGPVSS